MDDDTEIRGRFEVENAAIGWMLLDPLGELSIAVWHTDTPTGDASLADELSHRGLPGTANADVAEMMVLA